MGKLQSRTFVGDFETTVYEGQTSTEVWASAVVELHTEDVQIFHSIEETFDFLKSLKSHVVIYYHNLKFDGEFWMYYLLKIGLKQAYKQPTDSVESITFDERRVMPNNSFVYNISDRGQWYKLLLKINGYYIEIRDSLKLIPFSVKTIGQSFNTKHKKLEMEYEGYRYAGCEITSTEREYIANDVLVVKEALEFMFDEGHRSLTIGSCCLKEYKRLDPDMYSIYFPDLTQIELDPAIYDATNVDQYVRRSYKGGWCYVVEGKENRVYKRGTTADVNSLYPSMMHSESGNRYPVSRPKMWSGNFIPDEALQDNRYFFIRIRTRFYLKEGKLPFIQIKGNLLYKPTECLKTSDWRNRKTGTYHRFLKDDNGNNVPTTVTMTLTCTDYWLFLEHYNVKDFEILDGCYFRTEIGIFDQYIDKYKEIKLTSKGARKTLAKLYLNNLYGKLATSKISSFKVSYMKDDGVVGYFPVPAQDKDVVYIPCGSAITSYARNFTIRAAQANYHGVDEDGFIYADTDSIHCSLPPDQIVGITVHEKNFCCWKLESCWDEAIFVRQKTYIERVTHEDLQPVDHPYYNIKCAGMPDKCKSLFNACLTNTDLPPERKAKLTADERNFLYDENGELRKMTISDFKVDLEVPGKLVPKRIQGGVLLTNTVYTMRRV